MMLNDYTVGMTIGSRSERVTVQAEDALIAALKAKAAHPEAAITYSRRRNDRGDLRNPTLGLEEEIRRGG
jgi:hypothetical protein